MMRRLKRHSKLKAQVNPWASFYVKIITKNVDIYFELLYYVVNEVRNVFFKPNKSNCIILRGYLIVP